MWKVYVYKAVAFLLGMTPIYHRNVNNCHINVLAMQRNAAYNAFVDDLKRVKKEIRIDIPDRSIAGENFKPIIDVLERKKARDFIILCLMFTFIPFSIIIGV